MTATLLLLMLLALLASSPFPSPDAGGDGALFGVVFAHASNKLPFCARLSDLTSYGVNGGLMGGGSVTYYLDAQYFCANTAPAQYHCKCSHTTRCQRKPDPWGRNIGMCECCAGWMIACFTLMGVIFFIGILAAVYAVFCRNCWWCDGYVVPPLSLMPRRGPAVTCPPRRPIPDNLFRGYMSSDFINVVDNFGEQADGDAEPENGNADEEDGEHDTPMNAFAPGEEGSETVRSDPERASLLQHV